MILWHIVNATKVVVTFDSSVFIHSQVCVHTLDQVELDSQQLYYMPSMWRASDIHPLQCIIAYFTCLYRRATITRYSNGMSISTILFQSSLRGKIWKAFLNQQNNNKVFFLIVDSLPWLLSMWLNGLFWSKSYLPKCSFACTFSPCAYLLCHNSAII